MKNGLEKMCCDELRDKGVGVRVTYTTAARRPAWRDARRKARCEMQQLNRLSTLSAVSGYLSLHGTKVVEQRRIVSSKLDSKLGETSDNK